MLSKTPQVTSEFVMHSKEKLHSTQEVTFEGFYQNNQLVFGIAQTLLTG